MTSTVPASEARTTIVEPPALGALDQIVPGAGQIRGRIDAVDGGMIFGWAYDEAHPADRLEVRILHGEREIGRVTADRPRADLKRLGIGQGTHAFVCALPEGLAPDMSALTAVAVSARGTETALERPLRLDIADDAVASQIRRIADLLEASLLRQDDMRGLQQSMVGALRTIHAAQRRDGAEDAVLDDETRAAVERALAAVEAGQKELSERMTQLDVFQLRFDETLTLFDQRLRAIASAADQPLRRAVAALTVFTGIVAGIAIYAAAIQRL